MNKRDLLSIYRSAAKRAQRAGDTARAKRYLRTSGRYAIQIWDEAQPRRQACHNRVVLDSSLER